MYLRRTLKADAAQHDIDARGGYAQVAYTLTGEPRVYKLDGAKFDGAKFDAVKPANKQLGAWEIFYRYNAISVEDDNLAVSTTTRQTGDAEGKLHTLGVNWYANEAVKVSANYIKASTDKVSNSLPTQACCRLGDSMIRHSPITPRCQQDSRLYSPCFCIWRIRTLT